MNPNDIIESGVLESYALGLASGQEQELIRRATSEDPDLQQYMIDVETNVQNFFNSKAVPPPSELREIILMRNADPEVQKKKHVFNKPGDEDEKPDKNKFMDIEVNETYIKVHKYWRPAFIAVFILSKIFLIAGLYYYFKASNMEQEVIKLRTEFRP